MHQKSPRVFYGWWIVSASFLTSLYVGGVVFYGFTAIFEPIADELGWSYTQISLSASLRGLEMGILAPIMGLFTDRWGPKRIVFGGVVSAAAGLILLSQTNSLGMFYGAFVLIAIGMSGCTMTVLMTAVANWFRRRVGIASGIAMSGFGFSGLIIPLIVSLVATFDWRATTVILAVGMLVLLLPVSFVFRHKPEQYGYLPDGELEGQAATGGGPVPAQAIEVDITGKEALKSGTFWRIALAFTCHILLVTAVVTHVMPYLSSVGVARARSALIATGIPLASIAGRLGLGWFGDRFNKKVVTALGFATMGLGLFCFGYAPNAGMWLLVPFLILFGFGYGGINAMRPSMVREYFGRANFGAVFGLIMGIGMIGSIVGPTLAGWAYDTWGSYQGIWFILAGTPGAALVAILTITPVRRTVEPGEPT